MASEIYSVTRSCDSVVYYSLKSLVIVQYVLFSILFMKNHTVSISFRTQPNIGESEDF